ncbi:MAG: hypothetical protein ACFFCW_17665 [Candidatus Hodarchaeota archaeon]
MKQKPMPPGHLIENIDAASKNARNIYKIYIGLLAYCIFRVFGISDRQIIFNEAILVPYAKCSVPLDAFFVLTPLVAILIFVYLQVYLHRVKGLISKLETNYAPIDRKFVFTECLASCILGRIPTMFIQFTLWYLLPMVLIFIVIKFVKKHHPILSYVVGFEQILGTFIVFGIWFKYEFQSKIKPSFMLKNPCKAGFAIFVAIKNKRCQVSTFDKFMDLEGALVLKQLLYI